MRTRAIALALAAGCVLMASACFNGNGPKTVVTGDRFEVATASVVLGARQLLVDSSNGDVWVLEGDGAPEARWVLLARGPEDARQIEPRQVPEPDAPEE